MICWGSLKVTGFDYKKHIDRKAMSPTLEYIELKKGTQEINIDWDSSEWKVFEDEGEVFISFRLIGVYFNDEYANSRIDEIKGSVVDYFELYRYDNTDDFKVEHILLDFEDFNVDDSYEISQDVYEDINYEITGDGSWVDYRGNYIEKEIGQQEDFELVLSSAVRYALGRATYIVGVVTRYTKSLVPNLSTNTLHNIARDISETKNFGMEIDKQDWMSLLAVINNELNNRGEKTYGIANGET